MYNCYLYHSCTLVNHTRYYACFHTFILFYCKLALLPKRSLCTTERRECTCRVCTPKYCILCVSSVSNYLLSHQPIFVAQYRDIIEHKCNHLSTGIFWSPSNVTSICPSCLKGRALDEFLLERCFSFQLLCTILQMLWKRNDKDFIDCKYIIKYACR